jgi:hypothetical protein
MRFGTRSTKKQVSLVPRTELLARNRERGARQTGSKKIDSFERSAAHSFDIFFEDEPLRTVQAEGITTVGIDLDYGLVTVPSRFKADRLAARTSAQFHGSQAHRCP